ncbi:MAG: formate/nitrite transporter family protein [Candidatus Limnocylindrales bacterium]|jgi:formate/nitrite transporter FocA (FNT family)
MALSGLTSTAMAVPGTSGHTGPGFLDALNPPDMARKAVDVGISKIKLDIRTSFLLSILAGAFIALGAIFSLTVTAGASGAAAGGPSLPYGVTRLLAGLAFSLGLVLVVVGGAELVTGNVLLLDRERVIHPGGSGGSGRGAASFWIAIGSSADLLERDLGGFVSNLIPVTRGNMVGSALLVAATAWPAYLRHERAPGDHAPMQEDRR